MKLLEFIHNKHHIHRDIKPDNFMMGIGDYEDQLYIIDFGLSKKYRSSGGKSHIKFRNNKPITGTARYCSINTHKGYEQSRRDDLESLGYVMIYFINGILPWQGLKVNQNEDHYNKIQKKKESTSVKDLCSNLPSIYNIDIVQFVKYFEYIKNLGFEDEPNYMYCINLFNDILAGLGPTAELDWLVSCKSSINVEDLRKSNTSLVPNNNISNNTKLQKNGSCIISEDIAKNSIFKNRYI